MYIVEALVEAKHVRPNQREFFFRNPKIRIFNRQNYDNFHGSPAGGLVLEERVDATDAVREFTKLLVQQGTVYPVLPPASRVGREVSSYYDFPFEEAGRNILWPDQWKQAVIGWVCQGDLQKIQANVARHQEALER